MSLDFLWFPRACGHSRFLAGDTQHTPFLSAGAPDITYLKRAVPLVMRRYVDYMRTCSGSC
jgi:hypothetical protein